MFFFSACDSPAYCNCRCPPYPSFKVWLASLAGASFAFQKVNCYAGIWGQGSESCVVVSASVAHDARCVNTISERAMGITDVNTHGSHYAHCSLIYNNKEMNKLEGRSDLYLSMRGHPNAVWKRRVLSDS